MMPESVKRSVLSSGTLLALAALFGTGLLWLTSWHAQAYIADNERRALLNSLNAVIPAQDYDNDLLDDVIQVRSDELGKPGMQSRVYRARQQQSPTAVAMTVVAPDGYSGDIQILVGINVDGMVSGVRVLKHRETPGLGDEIEVDRSDWIRGFEGKSLNRPTLNRWKVKKDGGEFDQFSGATITPRAVVKAVRRSLEFYARHKGRLFSSPSHQTLVLSVRENKQS